MPNLEQKLIDYALGLLSKEDSVGIQTLITNDDQAAKLYTEVQESLNLLGNSAKPSQPSADLKSRVLEVCNFHTETLNLLPIENLPVAPPLPNVRYSGGGGTVDLNDLGKSGLRDRIHRLYEGMVELKELVSGTSSASEGDLTELCKKAETIYLEVPEHNAVCTNGVSNVSSREAVHSFLRTQLTSLPSIGHFLKKVGQGKGKRGDVRRLFYLCRDQMKIMRASFSDLDAPLLAEDEKLRLHGAGLLRTKWWGAEHSYYNEPGKVLCGSFFEGPITERCVEFAEYDSNIYCLANLLGSKSISGDFQIDLDNSKIAQSTLATLRAKTKLADHSSLQEIILQAFRKDDMNEDQYLAHLVKSSISRAFKLDSSTEALDANLMGCERKGNESILWFVWPAINEAQGGGEATTSNPLQ
tara:strand:+ start:1193 stop:2431 length:1239 start_codon:yes stop_codon:yes gene_type:complete